MSKPIEVICSQCNESFEIDRPEVDCPKCNKRWELPAMDNHDEDNHINFGGTKQVW